MRVHSAPEFAHHLTGKARSGSKMEFYDILLNENYSYVYEKELRSMNFA